MQTATTQESPPQLAPPGAGIPFLHLVFLRLFVKPFVASKSSLQASKKTFEKVTEKILKEIDGLSDEDLNQKILVPSQKGLEDSSRYWSISMTLEHLGIVGRKLMMVIQALSNNKEIIEKADIGKLKPFGQMSAQESMQDFRNFVSEYSRIQVPHPDSKNRYHHPWFGMMNCRQWYWLLGAHQAIHLQQIRAIKKGLQAKKVSP